MDQNWERVQSLFLEASDLPAEERAQFLAAAAGDDAELRREVESLLACSPAGELRILEALAGTAQSLLDSEDIAGTRLGPWLVLEKIGCGGMGAVYLAARDDDQFQKRVAIKVIKRGMDTVELLRRFRRERQILANLDHPYIARLIDGGSTVHGQPFLVMEFVDGCPIDVYCHEHELDVDARCRLFLKVCEAVSYAHRNLVVHRDLKPRNILVTSGGSPKLLDFGVAKLLDSELDLGDAPTLVPGRLLTPEYASPEQVRGEFVGTASDVYGLGAILYELLAGVKAQPVDSTMPAELERVICRTEVQAPSLRLKPADVRQSKRVSGDLDNIVLMAMCKEPARRYSSVDKLAEDLCRHLDGRTVIARPPSLGYRLGKFALRNRLGLTAAGLVLISMAGGTWAALAGAHRARIEQRRAETRLSQMVELADRALFDVHGSIERLPGATDARRQLVNTTLDYLQKLSQDAGDDSGLRRALGAAYLRLGDLQGYPYTPNLGDAAGAMKSYRMSSALLDSLRRAHPADAEAQRLWLEDQERLATLLAGAGDVEAASKLLRDGLPAALALTQLPHVAADADHLLGEFYSRLAEATRKHDENEALSYARRSLEIFRGLATRFSDRSDFLLEQSDAYSLVGRILQRQGDRRGAWEHFLESVALREALVKSHPNDVVYKRNLMIGYGHVGDLLGSPIADNLGDSEGARLYYRKAFAIAQQIRNADLRDATAEFDVAASLERLGMVEVPASSVTESLLALQRSANILDRLAANQPSSLRVQQMLALVLEYTGHRLQTMGRYGEAIASYRRSLTVCDGILAADPSDRAVLSQVVASGRGLATALAMGGDRVGAIRQSRVTIARAEAGVNAGPEKRIRELYLAESTLEMGSIYEILAKKSPLSPRNRDWESARSAIRRAITLLDTLAPGNKLSSIENRDRQKAENLLAEADSRLSRSPSPASDVALSRSPTPR